MHKITPGWRTEYVSRFVLSEKSLHHIQSAAPTELNGVCPGYLGLPPQATGCRRYAAFGESL
jgi:hypothetical protein